MLVNYFVWHYGRALREVFVISENFLVFAAHLFSIKELLRSLFAPWKHIAYETRGIPTLSTEALWILWTNFISRILGAIARLSLLVLGFLFFGWMLLGVSLFVLFWLVGPFIPPALFYFGFTHL